MISGLGFAETIVILMLVVMFFGTKELPKLIRETAKVVARVRSYSNKLKHEFNSITNPIDPSIPDHTPGIASKREQLRQQSLTNRQNLDTAQKKELSRSIAQHLLNSAPYKEAKAVMIYLNTADEVETEEIIQRMLTDGKRVILPYSGPSEDLALAEIKDLTTDITEEKQPHQHLKGNFLKSDLQLIVCPGVCFDSTGTRLGRGKGQYDRFLREIKGFAPIFSIAFETQICPEQLPFDYGDIHMDQIITENGMKL